MAKTKAGIPENADFKVELRYRQTDRQTDRGQTGPVNPPPRAGNLYPVDGLASPPTPIKHPDARVPDVFRAPAQASPWRGGSFLKSWILEGAPHSETLVSPAEQFLEGAPPFF